VLPQRGRLYSLNIVFVKYITTFRTEFRWMMRVLRLPTALVALIKWRICWLLGTTIRAELTLIYTATAAGPALWLWLFGTALGTELTGIFSAAGALPRIARWSCCHW